MGWIVGRNPVLEALRAGRRRVRRLWVARSAQGPELAELREQAAQQGVPIVEVDRAQLDRRAGGLSHQGVIAEVDPPPELSFSEWLQQQAAADSGLVLLLDRVQDPQNVGAILRSAEAAGANGVIAPRRGAPGLTPAVLKAAAGAAEHLPYLRVPNLVRTLEQLQAAGFWVFGAESDPEANPTPYDEIEYPAKTALVIGNEGEGLRRLVAQRCDRLVHIPLYGSIESLNASVAAAILLFAVRRSWKEQDKR